MKKKYKTTLAQRRRSAETYRRIKNDPKLHAGFLTKQAKYRASPKVRARCHANKVRYVTSRKGRDTTSRYKKSAKYRESNAAYANSPKGRATILRGRLRRKFIIDQIDYDKMLRDQNGVCAICSSPPTRLRYGILHVDHDHLTGKVRGLLCRLCNLGLGNFRDSPTATGAATRYLEKHSQTSVVTEGA